MNRNAQPGWGQIRQLIRLLKFSRTCEGEDLNPLPLWTRPDMARCAFDLDFLISQQPRSVRPAPVRTPAPNELEYLDVFDFFNYPRLPPSLENFNTGAMGLSDALGEANPTAALNSYAATNFVVPNPESDWLFQAAS